MPKLICCQDVYSDAPPPVGRGDVQVGDFVDNGSDVFIVMPGPSLWSVGTTAAPYLRDVFAEKARLATILEDADKQILRQEVENKTLRESMEDKIRDLMGLMERCVTPTMAPPSGVDEFVGWVERIGKVFR
jgi:hypothetical protein